MNRSRILGSIPIVAGVMLMTTIIFKSDNQADALSLELFAGSCLGYVFCLVALFTFRSAMPAVLGACLALAVDLLLFNEVFWHPQGSMGGLAILGVPIFNAVLCTLGILIGWIAMALARRAAARESTS